MKRTSWITLAVGLMLLAPGLGLRDFWPPDEARYAEVAVEMEAAETWRIPRLNGERYGDKPPGYFWLIRLFGRLTGGIDAAAARWPSVAGALLSLLAVVGLAGGPGRLSTGFFSAALLVASPWFYWQSRFGQMDVLMTGLIATGVVGVWKAVGDRQPRLLVLAGAAFGFALLVKGPLVLPGLGVAGLGVLLSRRRWRDGAALGRAWRGSLAAGVLLLVLPFSVWLAAAVGVEGWGYPGELVGVHVLERVRTGLAHVQPWWFYLEKLPWEFAPASFLILPWAFPKLRRGLEEGERRRAILMAIWVVVFLLLLSLLPGKRSVYLLVIHPPLAVLAAIPLASWWRRMAGGSSPGPGRWAVLAFAAFSTALGLILLLMAGGVLGLEHALAGSWGRLPWSRALPRPGWPPEASVFRGACGVAAVAPLLGGLAGGALAVTRRVRPAIVVQMASWPLLWLSLCLGVVPLMNPLSSRRAFARTVRRVAGEKAPLSMYRNLDEGVLFYVGRPLLEIRPEEPNREGSREARRARELRLCERSLRRWLDLPGERYCVVRGPDLAAFHDLAAGRDFRIVATGVLGRRRAAYLIAPIPPRERVR